MIMIDETAMNNKTYECCKLSSSLAIPTYETWSIFPLKFETSQVF